MAVARLKTRPAMAETEETTSMLGWVRGEEGGRRHFRGEVRTRLGDARRLARRLLQWRLLVVHEARAFLLGSWMDVKGI